MNPEWIPYISLGLRYAATLGNVGNRWVFTLKGLRQRVSRHNPFRVAGGCGVSSPGVAAYRNPGLGYAALSGQLIGLLYHARCQVGFYISRSQVVLGNGLSLEVVLPASSRIPGRLSNQGNYPKVAKCNFADKDVPKWNLGTSLKIRTNFRSRINYHSDHRYVVHALACASGHGMPHTLKREQHTFSSRSQVELGNGAVLEVAVMEGQ